MQTGTGARGLGPSPPSHWAPGGRIMNPAGRSASLVAWFPVSLAPVRPHDPRGSSPGRWEAGGTQGQVGFLPLDSCTARSSFPESLSFPPDSKV